MKQELKLILVFTVYVMLSGCKTTVTPQQQPAVETKPTTQLKLAWDNSKYWALNWNITLRSEIARYDWSKVTTPCKTVDKEECVAQLMAKMTQYESSFNPSEVYRESGNLAGIDSIGLFQLSIESEKKLCSLSTKEDLKKPLTNIACAVAVLNKWSVKDGVLYGGQKGAWLGGSRYWSVLRTSSGSYTKIMLLMGGL